MTKVAKKTQSQESFDTLFNKDEKQVAREIKYSEHKEGKKMQLLAQLNQIRMKSMKAQNEYKKSLIDPMANSIELQIEIMSLDREFEIGKNIFSQLFPDEKFL